MGELIVSVWVRARMTVAGLKTQQAERELREENAYLRSLLRQLEAHETVEDREEPQTNDRATKRAAAASSSARLELAQAEERIRQLETHLLDAEETICHLKAEKRAALRDVERLERALSRATGGASREESDDDASTSSQEQERQENKRLENEEEEVRQEPVEGDFILQLQQEEHMAVIREQEQEIRALQDQLTEATGQLQAMQTQTIVSLERMSSVGDLQASSMLTDGLDTTPALMRRSSSGDAGNFHTWQEELVRHPTPHFDLDSPEVLYVLQSWTRNVKKLQFLRMWFAQIVATRGNLPQDLPLRIELPRLLPEIRDGFLTLVVPLLRKQTRRDIHVYARQYNDQVHTDLRICVVPRF